LTSEEVTAHYIKFWGMDNNLTRNISAKDPASIGIWKGIAAGGISLALAAYLRNQLLVLATAIGAMLLDLFV
jgi:hypothetical protein